MAKPKTKNTTKKTATKKAATKKTATKKAATKKAATKKPKPGPGKHARFGPSSLKSLEICPHYRGYKGSSRAADAGTRMHEFIELYAETLKSKKATRGAGGKTRTNQGLDLTPKLKSLLGQFDNLDQERLVVICEHIRPIILSPGATTHVEIRLDVAGMTFGTCDLAVEMADGLVIKGRDWKFGEWEVDHPICNAQVWAYVVGLFHHFPDARHVEFGLYQPKISLDVPLHQFNRDQLPELIDRVSKAQVRAEQAEDHAEDMHELTSHCIFCRRKVDCPKFLNTVKNPQLKKLLVTNKLTVPKDLETPARRKAAALLASMLKSYGDDLKKELAVRWAEEGAEVDQHILVNAKGKRTVKKDDRVSAFEAGIFGLCEGDDELAESALEVLQLTLGDDYESFISALDMVVGAVPGKAMFKIDEGGLVNTGEPSVYIRQKKL